VNPQSASRARIQPRNEKFDRLAVYLRRFVVNQVTGLPNR
jgi:hypothetical protein